MILELILAGILQWNLQNKNLEKRVGNGKLQFSVYILRSDVGANRRNFILGDSRFQTEEKEKIRSQQKLAANASQHGSSYSGTGTQVEIVGYSRLQCVPFARKETGNPKIKGYAGDLVPETQTPQIGAVALETFKSKKGTIGHASVVIAIYNGKV